mmetsp:Transcript_20003/g.63860  ORF Transcript_20003/g.63860 Transcript_20003/m.63860 type:complete len:268 (+) Transcript_20003:1487-2290(+)
MTPTRWRPFFALARPTSSSRPSASPAPSPARTRCSTSRCSAPSSTARSRCRRRASSSRTTTPRTSIPRSGATTRWPSRPAARTTTATWCGTGPLGGGGRTSSPPRRGSARERSTPSPSSRSWWVPSSTTTSRPEAGRPRTRAPSATRRRRASRLLARSPRSRLSPSPTRWRPSVTTHSGARSEGIRRAASLHGYVCPLPGVHSCTPAYAQPLARWSCMLRGVAPLSLAPERAPVRWPCSSSPSGSRRTSFPGRGAPFSAHHMLGQLC